ncbi:MAG: energy-coupling factor transporter transmembrane protein EcfT [Spirochaetaceae bacterium]|jgi:energy-coupling factor transport system permease protein|nr:energy-coupling factor transporter transmembrane protein EcfT [Spirochaetaceae bacterium]
MYSGERALSGAVRTENSAVHTRGFHAAVKVLVVFCAILGVSLTADINRTWVLSLMGLAYLLFQRSWKQFINWLVFYGLLSGFWFLNLRYGFHTKIISEFYIYTFWWLAPVFIVSWDLMTSPPGNLIALFSRLRVPSPVILGTLVIFRFFPTMRTELRSLGESLRNRGMLEPGNLLRHPLAVFEYTLVPLLLRCLQIADQLSVSAISRGIEAPVKRESYYEQKMKGRDYLCMAAAGTGTLFFLLYWGIG